MIEQKSDSYIGRMSKTDLWQKLATIWGELIKDPRCHNLAIFMTRQFNAMIEDKNSSSRKTLNRNQSDRTTI